MCLLPGCIEAIVCFSAVCGGITEICNKLDGKSQEDKPLLDTRCVETRKNYSKYN